MPQLFPVAAGWSPDQLADAPSIALPPAPRPEELGDFEHETYHLEPGTAVSLGFTLPPLPATLNHAVLLLGTTRYRDLVVGVDTHVFRFGVSIRTLMIISAEKLDFALTLPIVAARVELGGAQATAVVSVRGYKGALSPEDLPEWHEFDVDAYATYMAKLAQLRTTILSADPSTVVPELLATSYVPAGVGAAAEDPSTALGVVFALQAIAHGMSLWRALDKYCTTDPHADIFLKAMYFGTADRQSDAAVRRVYRERVGGDERKDPDKRTQQDAQAQLSNLHIL